MMRQAFSGGALWPLAGLAILSYPMVSAPPASAQSLTAARQRCVNPEPEIKIVGCTEIILSDKETPQNLAVAYSNRAAGYDALGRHDRAVADADKAVALNPDYADAYNERAWARHGEGHDAEALPDAEKAVALAPDDPYSLETRAEIYEKLGRKADAISDYRAALKLSPGLKPAVDGLRRVSSP
jgi:tetratricopeptide (TPR) repeat protein